MIRFWCIIFVNILFQNCFGSDVLSLPYITNDIEYARTRGKLYAVVDALDPEFGNRLIEINVSTGIVERSVFAGTDPRLLRITSDENYAWVSFTNIPFIRRINLNTFEIDKDIYLGPSKKYEPPHTVFSTVLTTNFTLLPGEDNQVALSLRKPFDFEFESLSLYRNDTILPVRIMEAQLPYYPFCLEPVMNGSYLVGHYQSNWNSEYSTVKVLANGLELTRENVFDLDGMSLYRNWFKVIHDTIYTATGEVLNATDTSGIRKIDSCRTQIIGDRYGFAFSPFHDAFLYPEMSGDSLFLAMYDRKTFGRFDSVYLFDYPFYEIMLITELEVIDQTRFAVVIGKDYGDFSIRIVDTKNNGIESKNPEDNVRIYPNPTSGKLWVSGGPLNKKISVYNMIGNLAGTYQCSGIREELDLSGYPSGVYTVKIIGDRGSKAIIRKIIVQ